MQKRLLTLSLLFCAFHGLLQAQKDTQFWFVAPEITQGLNDYDRPVAFRFSTYNAPAVVTISQPANPGFVPYVIFLGANATATQMFPPFFSDVENTPANTVLNKGFLIESDAPITAYYEVIGLTQANPEIFSLKGKNALGTTFFTPFQNLTSNSSSYSPLPHAAFDLVATEDNTTVTITPSRPLVGHAANVPYSISLNRGQTYSGQAIDQTANGHPTGTLVTSNKPIAVTVKDDLLESGVLFGGFCRDMIGDQIVPIEKVGKTYVIQKGMLDDVEYAFIVGTENGTSVSLDGSVLGTVNAGQTLTLPINAGSHFLESSAPVYVWQMTGNGCEVGGAILPTLDCSGSASVRFVRTNNEPFSLVLVTRTGNEDGFLLNNNPSLIPSSAFQPVPGSNGAFQAAMISFNTLNIVPGQSSIVSNSQGVFQMGLLNGTPSGTGCRFAFFSDFGNQTVVEEVVQFCSGDSVTLHGLTLKTSGVFTAVATNAQGCDTLFEINATMLPLATDTIDVSLCAGDSINIDGLSYAAPNVVNDTIAGLSGTCDSILTYLLTLVAQPVLHDTISFCPGTSVTIGGNVYTQAGTVVDTIPSATGGCDTIATYTLIVLPQNRDTVSIDLCPGETFTLDGNAYSAPNIVLDTIASSTGGCDTVRTYVLIRLPQPVLIDTISFCPGTSVTIGGQVYSQDGTVVDTIPSATGGCDTIATYTLILLPQYTEQLNVNLCPGQAFIINGIAYTAPNNIHDTIPSTTGGCDTLRTYKLIQLWSSQPELMDTFSFCPGTTVTIGGEVYTQAGTVVDTIPSTTGGCDTIAIYTLVMLPQPTRSETITFCPGATVTIGGNVYTQAATVIDTISSATGGCDTIATYTLVLLPQPTRNETIAFCRGASVTIGGQEYDQPGTVIDTIASLTGGCDTIATYTLVWLPQPQTNQTISFCKGDEVLINGAAYTEPGIVLDTIPSASGGCDTLATYVLQYLVPNQPTHMNITCPANISVEAAPGASGVAVNFGGANAFTDCPCPGIQILQNSGQASGSLFPIGNNPVCFTAKDSCGNTTSCCFTVAVQAAPSACDVKVIGCMKFELLGISQDAGLNRTYRIRVTNTCANKMIYTAFELPAGVTAIAPADGSTYAAQSGRTYQVRNPNYSPFHSIRFRSLSDSLQNNQFDVFSYKLPAQTNAQAYIHVIARLEPVSFYEAYLNTFFCPIAQEPVNGPGTKPGIEKAGLENTLRIFPNPTDGALWLDWAEQSTADVSSLRILNAQGQLVQEINTDPEAGIQRIVLTEGLASGLYYLEMVDSKGSREVQRFVLQR